MKKKMRRQTSLKLRSTMSVITSALLVTSIATLLIHHFEVFELNLISFTFIYLASINIVTFFTYGIDKRRAVKGNSLRIPEFTLVATVFLGGTLGAHLGRKVFKHKTIKKSFRLKFWSAVILQALIITGLLWMQYH